MTNLKRNLELKSDFINPTQLLLNFLDAVGGGVGYNDLYLALDKINHI